VYIHKSTALLSIFW